MSTFDWVFPLILIQSVVRQLRGKRLSPFGLTWPIALVGWAAFSYVQGFPARTSDLVLVSACGMAGAALGLLAGRSTLIYKGDDDRLMARSQKSTVAYWSLGSVGRLIFGLYATNGGGPTIERFSVAHGLTLGAWASALTLMALVEVIGRSAYLIPRALQARGHQDHRSPPARTGRTATYPSTERPYPRRSIVTKDSHRPSGPAESVDEDGQTSS
jgi:hypothetical protein